MSTTDSAMKKTWTDPQLHRLDRPLADRTKTGLIFPGVESAPTVYNGGFFYTS